MPVSFLHQTRDACIRYAMNYITDATIQVLKSLHPTHFYVWAAVPTLNVDNFVSTRDAVLDG
eukprot:4557821-Amphidinium_carterae.1